MCAWFFLHYLFEVSLEGKSTSNLNAVAGPGSFTAKGATNPQRSRQGEASATIGLKDRTYLVLQATNATNCCINLFQSSYRRDLCDFFAFVAVKRAARS
jgi:hypothetical protein